MGKHPRIKVALGLGFFEPFSFTVNRILDSKELFDQFINKKFKAYGEEVLSKKTSETLFILGSGPSAGKLTPDQLKEISEQDSLAFNDWFLHHSFVPSHYILQFKRTSETHAIVSQALKDKASMFKKTNIFLRGDEQTFAKDLIYDLEKYEFGARPAFFVPEWPISTDSQIDPNKYLQVLSQAGFLNHGKTASFVPRPAGTAGLAMCLAMQMGYKQIVLTGIDLEGAGYFFSQPPNSKLSILPWMSSRSPFDATVRGGPSHGKWTGELAAFFIKKGVRVYASHPESPMAKNIPVWIWGQGRKSQVKNYQ